MRHTLAVVLAVTSAHVVLAQDHAHPAGNPERLGTLSFNVSCAPGTQPRFERAIAMTHSFWFDAADAAFAEIIRNDSTCALAYWGRSINILGNPMGRVAPPAERLKQGMVWAQRAQALAQTASHREQMWAATAMAYYAGYETRDHFARMASLEQSLDALRRAHPEDMEAAIFYARTLVANSPPSDLTFAKALAGADILQPLFDKHPDHPGLAHYLIHAYDAPPIAARGLKAAQAYAQIAPSAPHALHMPSHTFTRVGMWNESIETNIRSARAEPDSNGAVHALDYMVYAYLQQGRDQAAKKVVDRAVFRAERFYGTFIGYNSVAMPARYALERSAWSEAADLKIPVNAAPYAQAITHFARAVGASRIGNPKAARADADSLAALKARLDAAKDTYWATIVEAQRQVASSWIASAEHDTAAALRLARSAAELEETVEKNAVTPGPLLPARELEGDLFMELRRWSDALASYEKTLTREPRRLRAVYGAARAAERAGNVNVAQARYREVLDLMQSADATRPEPAAAKRYLREH